MEEPATTPHSGLRQHNMKKSFHVAIRSLLTTCSKSDFTKAFSTLKPADREIIYKLFVQVISSLHENIEDQFKSLCEETQVCAILDILEQAVEEQSLDHLFSSRSNMGDLVLALSNKKMKEIEHLKSKLEMGERWKVEMKAKVERMEKESDDFSSLEELQNKALESRKYLVPHINPPPQ